MSLIIIIIIIIMRKRFVRQSRSSEPSPQLSCPLHSWLISTQLPLSHANSSVLQVSSTSVNKCISNPSTRSSILLCSPGWRARRDSTFAPSPQTYATAASEEGRVRERANLLWLRRQVTDSSEQSQRASCEPLTAVAERVSDNCLGTQNPALCARADLDRCA